MQQQAAAAPQMAAIYPTAVRSDALRATIALFAVTMFAGAGLLFLVQPMFAKLALPRLGGSPAVWNTCVLFFQATLLLGYLYAHFSTRWLGVRRQAYFHSLLLLAPLVALPLTLGDVRPPASGSPTWWLLVTMTYTVGLPFFVVSTTAPLLQRWFAALPVPSARDPYFLYAASNLGSMLSLLAYPFVLEPAIGASQQTWLWTIGYVVLLGLTAGCAIVVRRFSRETETVDASARPVTSEIPTPRQRLPWVILSFIPSSLMLGVTTHISTDVAAVPLLWVVPLAMYLGTFVLSFSTREVISHRWLVQVLPLLILACVSTLLFGVTTVWLIPLHLATFFVAAMVSHRELAQTRPGTQHLTEFYIWMSFGGMLGGVFNTLIAPKLFSSILEYPFVLALAAVARPSHCAHRARQEPLVVLIALPLCAFLACFSLWANGLLAASLGIREFLLVFATVLMAASLLVNRTGAFGAMSLISVGVIAASPSSAFGTPLFAARSFFGVHRVVDAPDHSHHLLQHGSTTHGRQEIPAKSTCEPTGYYHPSNPIGQLFHSATGRFADVAVVGLGSGALACYAQPGSNWTFYEIDQLVEQIARDTRYFTYLQNSRGRVSVVLGDGRIALQAMNSDTYDLIILDAFSSDAIPVHLLTREALELYFARIRPDGVVAVHISNRYLKLEPVLAALVERQGLFAVANFDGGIPAEEQRKGRFASHWVILTRSPEQLARLKGRPGWRSPTIAERVSPWTDDYSNILQALALN
jgi:hypothetical protein